MQLKVLTVNQSTAPVLGSFSKAIDGAVAINYGNSGGRHCDKRCIYHPENTSMPEKNRCYAARIETRFDRVELLKKMERHERSNPTDITVRALEELKHRYSKRVPEPVPWLRFSAFGSLPQPHRAGRRFIKALRKLLDFCDDMNIAVHMPVESEAKATFYRKKLGKRVIVRQSCQSENDWLKPGDREAKSIVAGVTEMSKRERLDEAKRLCEERTRLTHRKAIVCPAVAAPYHEYLRVRAAGGTHIQAQRAQLQLSVRRKELGLPLAKCGNCTACSMAGVDVVYPCH